MSSDEPVADVVQEEVPEEHSEEQNAADVVENTEESAEVVTESEGVGAEPSTEVEVEEVPDANEEDTEELEGANLNSETSDAGQTEQADAADIDAELIADTEGTTEQEAEGGPAAGTDVETEVVTEFEPAADIDDETEVGTEGEPAADAEVAAEQEAEGEPAADTEAATEQEAESEPAADAEVAAEQEAEGEPAADIKVATEQETEGEPAADTEVATEQEAEGDPAADTEVAAEQETEGEPAADTKVAADQETEGEPAADTEVAAEQEIEGEPAADTEVAAEHEAEDEPAADTEVGADQETEVDPSAEAEATTQNDPDSEPAAETDKTPDETVQETGEPPATDGEVSEPVADTDAKPTETEPVAKPTSPDATSKSGSPKPSDTKTGSKPTSPKTSKPGTPVTSENDSRVPTAPPPPKSPTRESTELNLEPGPDPLNLMWSFGVNERVPVLNITDENRKMIMYACAHTGIIYDINNNTQKLLQGHSNNITCTCVSRDKRWLATGDKGLDNTVIIWDTTTGFPVRTMFGPYPEGIVAIAITPDAKYLATLSAGDPQVVAIWDWTTGDDQPLHTAQLDAAYGLQNYLLFNPDDSSQLVSNSDHQVVFYAWTENSFEYFAPPLTDQDFNKPVGRYSHTIYLRESTRALTATSLGNMVVWDSNKPLTIVGTVPKPDKRALKLVKLQDTAMKVLTTTDDYIVIGDSMGHVRFLDQTLKLVNWYQDFDLGPISAISFAHVPEFEPIAKEGSDFPNDATIPSRKFVIKDFAVGTTSAVLGYVTSDGSTVDVVHRDHDAPVFALDTHPTESKFAVGSYSGLIKIWDYELKESVVSRYFEKGQMIRCCAFDPKGEYLAVGFMNGTVRILDAISLKDEQQEPFRYSREAITHLAFSHDSSYLATADADFTVTLYRSNHRHPDGWEHMGRRRPHYKLIVDMLFTIHLDTNLPRLLTLGEDRMLVEYDLSLSDQDDIVIANTDRIEQSATGLCLTMYPSITKEQFILTSNDQYKFKLYNSTTKMCRKTLLGPTYGSPLQKIVVLPADNPNTDPRYMTYITVDKVGITRMPLTGNPHDAMALIAHPSGVTNLVTSHDGQYMFTAGGADSIVHMWSTNLEVLEAQAKLGGEDLVPFYGLLDGGRDGELFAELEDYFYYAQIRSQGVNTMETRKVSTRIPLTEVPFVMRAMGFYPSEQEVLDMLNEVKYGQYVETGKYVDDIELGTFIKLYVNHRPAFGLDPDELSWVFHALADSKSDESEDQMDRGYLLDVLQSRGEHMTEYELAEYITTLLGYNSEGGSCELQEFDPAASGDIIADNLPYELTAKNFAEKVLGFTLSSDVLTLEQESSMV